MKTYLYRASNLKSTECLQYLYQSVGIHMKYVLLVLLQRLPKYLVL